MSTYRFGLSLPPTRRWIEVEWRAFDSSDRDEFVDAVLLQPERHLLPLSTGDAEDLSTLRRRLLDQLRRVFGEQALRAGLRRELDPILDGLDAGQEEVGANE